MKKFLLLTAAAMTACSLSAQTYITEAPEGGFNVASGKDYVILYSPDEIISRMAMGGKIATNCNLDPDQINNTLEYWVTDWDAKDLTLYNVPIEAGEKNSFGGEGFINATPLYAWGTGVFIPRAKNYDLSKVTNEHHLHIGLRDFGSSPSKYQFSVGSQKTIKNNGFQIMAGIKVGESSGDFVGIGEMPNGNDGKWYYIDIPVSDLVDEDGDFGFVYNFAAPITDGAFSFTFSDPTCSTVTKSGPAPGESVYSYEVTKLGSALSLDHIFFYVPDTAGVSNIDADQNVPTEYYDLTGRRVLNPAAGVYIVRSANGVKKVIF